MILVEVMLHVTKDVVGRDQPVHATGDERPRVRWLRLAETHSRRTMCAAASST